MPSTPDTPIPSIISRVSLKGTVSGVGKQRPCSNAIPMKPKLLTNYKIIIHEPTKIDMYNFGGIFVNKNVANVSVANTQDISAHTSCGDAVNVCSTPLIPNCRL